MYTVGQQNLILIGLSFLFGGAGAWFISRYAAKLGFIDIPTDRSSHETPTPKGGGIGISIGIIFVALQQSLCARIWVPAILLSLISLVGDRIDLSPKLRLSFQFIAAAVFLTGVELPDVIGLTRGTESGILFLMKPLLYLLGAVFIVGTTNFYNFMDGINGIAGITGIIAFILMGCFGLAAGQSNAMVIMCFTIAFGCLGFLPFNIPRARVFMGDVGSILLGFVFACCVVLFSRQISDFMVLVCFLFPFYADELITLFERIRDRQSLMKAHRRHLYQVLANEAGIAHWKISLGYGICQVVVGLSIWFLIRFHIAFGIIGFFLYVILFFKLNSLVKKHFLLLFRTSMESGINS